MSGNDRLDIGVCWGTLAQADLPGLIEAAARNGLPTLSMWTGMVDECLASGTSEPQLRRQLADSGVRIRVIDGYSSSFPSSAGRKPTILGGRELGATSEEQCFRAAGTVGCPILNVVLSGEPLSEAEATETVAAACRRAATHDLALALEFVPHTSIPDIATARRIVEACGEDNCGILLDPWQLARSGGTVADIEAIPTGMITAYQLCDWRPPPTGDDYPPMTGRSLPGEGELPLHDITRAALANNPELSAEVEVFAQELWDMSADDAAARIARSVDGWRAGL